MKNTELRIGNYVKRQCIVDGSDVICNVLELKRGKVLCNGSLNVLCEYSEIEPIEISEKWLIDFGFELIREYNYARFYNFEYPEMNYSFLIKILKGEIRVTHGNSLLRRVKYVHELQNLVFAISGIELQLNNNLYLFNT